MTRPVGRIAGVPRAFALVELLIALSLLGVVLGAVVGMAVAQQRAHAALAARRGARAQLRDGALALARELRPLALVDDGADPTDARALVDTLVEVLATTGGAVVCARPAERTVEIPGSDDTGGPALAWWTAEPRPGDVVLTLGAGDITRGGSDADGRAGRGRRPAVAVAGQTIAWCIWAT